MNIEEIVKKIIKGAKHPFISAVEHHSIEEWAEQITTFIEDREKKAVEGFAKALVERYFEKDQEFWGMTSSISAIDFEWFIESFINNPEQYFRKDTE